MTFHGGQKQKENMKITLALSGALLLGLALATPVQASITIDYSAAGWGPVNFKLNPAYPGDTLSMAAYGMTGLVLPDNMVITSKINGFDFYVDYSDDGSYGSAANNNFTASRLFSITVPSGGNQTISQNGVLNVSQYFDWVDIASGAPIVFNFAGIGTVTVTPLALSTGNVGDLGDHFYDVNADFLFTPVPEPTTMLAGALLLLPFGASTFRILRRSRTA